MNHLLHLCRTHLLIRALLQVSLLYGHLFSLGLQSHLLLLLKGVHLALRHCVVHILLHVAVHLPFHGLVHRSFAVTLLLGSLVHHVALTLRDDLICTLTRLIDLLDDLYAQREEVSEMLI